MSNLDLLASLQRRVAALERVETPRVETGTYTPTYTGATTPGTTSYAVQYGRYQIIGGVVVASGFVQWTAASGTGLARISLPIAATSDANYRGVVTLWVDGVTFAGSGVMGVINPGTTYFLLGTPSSNASPTVLAVEAAGLVLFQATYHR